MPFQRTLLTRLIAATLLALSTGSSASQEAAAARAGTSSAIRIPEQSIRGVLVTRPDELITHDPERLRAVARATPGQLVDLVGHIERLLPDGFVVVGRRVQTEYAGLEGGGRRDLQPGALVRVQGRAQLDGSIEAGKLVIQPARDASIEARIRDEVRKFKLEYFEKYEKLGDDAVQRYVTRVGNGLIPPYLEEPENRFTFTVVADPTPNAFALPDGSLVIHTGMLARLDNEAQLASVLGHEIAHVTQRHYIRSIENETSQKLLSIGAQIAQIALAASGNADTAQGISMMSSALISGYSRSFEDEADQVGLRYLYVAGYDVEQAPEVWRTFRRFYGDQSPVENYFYGSHSTAMARDANLSHEIRKAYAPAGLLGGRIELPVYRKSVAGATRRNGELEEERRWYSWARWDLRRAVADDPDDPRSHIALAKFLIQHDGGSGLRDALAALRRAVEIAPQSAEAHRLLGTTLLRAGQKEEGDAMIQRARELEPPAAPEPSPPKAADPQP